MEASDMKAMREALEHVEKLAREFAAGNYYVSDFPKMLLDAIQPALSAPPDEPVPERNKLGNAARVSSDETVADILREMRRANFQPPWYQVQIDAYADRIEAEARRAYKELDSVVCGIDDASCSEINDVRKAMDSTIGDYYE